MKKKQKNAKTGVTRMVTKTVQNDSFFNFFSPPEGMWNSSRCITQCVRYYLDLCSLSFVTLLTEDNSEFSKIFCFFLCTQYVCSVCICY